MGTLEYLCPSGGFRGQVYLPFSFLPSSPFHTPFTSLLFFLL